MTSASWRAPAALRRERYWSLSHRRPLGVVGDSDNVYRTERNSESTRRYREASRNFVEDTDVLPLSGRERLMSADYNLLRNPRRRVSMSGRRLSSGIDIVAPRCEEAPSVLKALIVAAQRTIEKSRPLIAEIDELLTKRH
jgi:hypothetical protein